MKEPLRLEGEYMVLEDGSVMVGGQELCSAMYDRFGGRAENIVVTVREVEDQE